MTADSSVQLTADYLVAWKALWLAAKKVEMKVGLSAAKMDARTVVKMGELTAARLVA